MVKYAFYCITGLLLNITFCNSLKRFFFIILTMNFSTLEM